MPTQSAHILGARSVELLGHAATWMNDCKDPFDREFLLEHDVTGDEAIALSTHMAIAVRALIHAPRAEQHRMLLAGLAEGEDPAVDALLQSAGQIAHDRARADEISGLLQHHTVRAEHAKQDADDIGNILFPPEPTILQHFGDRIDLRCECGNELTWVDQTSDRLTCGCGRVIEVAVTTKVRYA